MALPNNSNTVTYSYGGGNILLQASFHRLKNLSEAVGRDALAFITETIGAEREDGTQNTPHEQALSFVKIMFHLQAGSEIHSEEEIYNWLFGDLLGFMSKEENMLDLLKAVMKLLGRDVSELIAEVEAKQADSKKKEGPAASAPVEPVGAIS